MSVSRYCHYELTESLETSSNPFFKSTVTSLKHRCRHKKRRRFPQQCHRNRRRRCRRRRRRRQRRHRRRLRRPDSKETGLTSG